MGLLSRLFGGGSASESGSQDRSQSPPDIVLDEPLDGAFVHGEFQGERVTFEAESSPNGQWKGLYGRTAMREDTPIVLLSEDEEVQHAFTVTRAENVAVANSGHVAVTDIGEANNQSLGGTFDVVAPDGQPCIEHEFDANIWECAITEGGRYASTATHNPDRAVYVFDIEAGDLQTRFETPNLNSPAQEFGTQNGETVLYLLDGDEQYRGIDLDGTTVWRSQRLEKQDRIDDLLAESEEVSPEESIDLLEEAYQLTNDENETKTIANRLADAHWKASKRIRKEHGDTDEWWSHLNQAKQYYYEIESWYDGRKGVAKVARKQAKYHLKQGNENTALQLLQEIATLEDEYGTQLLTDADKEKIQSLS
ncbi:hypothetical protein B4589_004625 [Halolamina sp. CBA1230]|uniref:hypothetical protein n=1 Tax=Halolamina sp. CBA1230 TaxID=1853690 RepID=UPI0009A21FC1|nr:hypothetical protein [Halolamina sp. CBA1230]QKY19698.1 hypothetical protein B4589_004625 [Halolamina sp. CBA1230]